MPMPFSPAGSASCAPRRPMVPGRARRQDRQRRAPDQPLRERPHGPHPRSRGPPRRDLQLSTDYLLIHDAPRRSFADTGDELTERIGMASRLSATDKAAIVHIIDGLLANSRIRAAFDEAQ